MKEIYEEIIDQVYSLYESENSFQNDVYMHPMFYNGTFSKDNSYEPPKPEPLMTKEEFVAKLNEESLEYRWNTAAAVLYLYIDKQRNGEG